jgi:hypothetical protein
MGNRKYNGKEKKTWGGGRNLHLAKKEKSKRKKGNRKVFSQS